MDQAEFDRLLNTSKATLEAELGAARKKHEDFVAALNLVWQQAGPKRSDGTSFPPRSRYAVPRVPGANRAPMSLAQATRLVIGRFAEDQEFDADDVIQQLDKAEPHLNASERKASLSSHLSELRKTGYIERIYEGIGSEPHRYRRAATNGQHAKTH